jgi:hypothetical protein
MAVLFELAVTAVESQIRESAPRREQEPAEAPA